MRRWWRNAAAAADRVAGMPALWLPGALAWALTVGWLPLLGAVARPPDVADLTFLGARIHSSGAWPWNAVLIVAAMAAVGAAAFVLVSLAEVTLARPGRSVAASAVWRAAGAAALTALPAVAALLAAATAFVLVAMEEFVAPGTDDPLLRTLARLWPFGIVVVVTWTVGAAFHAPAVRAVARRGDGVAEALSRATSDLRRAGRAGLVTAGAILVARLAYLAVATILLRVLWASLAARLTATGIDVAVVPLLVGFVAIWLCLVLGGGALHAWGALTWSGVLGDGSPERPSGAGRLAQGDPHRP